MTARDRDPLLLRLGFGRQIARDHVVLDGAVAIEAQGLIGDPAQRGDAPQGMQPPLLLELGREASISTSMEAPRTNCSWPREATQ